MSTGGDDRDERTEDWFEDAGEPGGFRDPDAETWLGEEPQRPSGPRDRQPLLIAAAAAIVLLLLGVGIAWAVSGGGDDGNAATTETVTTTAQQTEPATTATQTETSPAVTATVPADVTLKNGDSGDEVMRLQEALVALGYDIGGEPDGSFGPATEEAVEKFQADSGLPADGVAGPQTLQAINDALAATGYTPHRTGYWRYPAPVAERCPSGLRSATGNRVPAERWVAGSNPALSACESGAPRVSPSRLVVRSPHGDS